MRPYFIGVVYERPGLDAPLTSSLSGLKNFTRKCILHEQVDVANAGRYF